MSKKLPISVFIISFNEVDRIAATITSVIDFVDEIIVVDSGSTDGTQGLARKMGARVLHNDWPGYGAQKYFAEQQCRNEWIFNLDADEVVSDNLIQEIKALFSPVPVAKIYKIQILDIFPHEERPKLGAYGYWQYRLYHKKYGSFSKSSVHDVVIPREGVKTARLRKKIWHRSVRSLGLSVEKLNRYSDMQLEDMLARGRTLSPIRLLFEFPFAFLKSYFIRRNFIYGFWGIIWAHNYAYSRFLRLAKAYEKQLLTKKNNNNQSK